VFDKKALMADKSLTKQQKEDLITILRRGPTQVWQQRVSTSLLLLLMSSSFSSAG
jgi:hypothetical protein